MFKKLKDKKGFTLVELIVVLVILAILAALLIPTLTGYIDKANQEKVVSECRMVVMAVQTELSESYGKAGAGNSLIAMLLQLQMLFGRIRRSRAINLLIQMNTLRKLKSCLKF